MNKKVKFIKKEEGRETAYLDSSELEKVVYHFEHKLLEAKFRKGDVYLYFDVPNGVYERLLAADSIGKYFNLHIRNSGYEYKKVN